MSEFTASLSVALEESSARSTRSQLEDELSGVTVPVETEVADSPGSAMSGITDDTPSGLPGDALEDQSTQLGEISSSWEDNLDLNETRNDLLRELLDAQERTASQGGGNSLLGGMGGLLVGGGALLGLSGVVIGKGLMNFLRDFRFSVPDIPPIPVPDIPPLSVPDIPPVPVPTIPDIDVPDIPPLSVPDIPPVPVPEIPELGVPEIPDVGVPDIPALGLPDIPDLGLPEIPDLGLPAIPDLDINPPPFPVPIPVSDPGKSPDSPSSPTGSPSVLDRLTASGGLYAAATMDAVEGGVDTVTDNPIASGITGGVGLMALLKGAGTVGASGAGGVFTRDMFDEDNRGNVREVILDLRERTSGRGTPASELPDASGTHVPDAGSPDGNRARNSSNGNTTINHNPTYEVDVSRLERMYERDIRELERRLKDVERTFSKGGGL